MIELTPSELAAQDEVELPLSPWVQVTQDRIVKFAEATGDYQWIHVDEQRAAQGPFGTTIAHGYLTVSLIPIMLGEILQVRSPMGVNYGIDRMRLTSPVPRDSRLRLRAKIVETEDQGKRVRYTMDVRVEVEGQERPALVGSITYLAYV